MAEVVEMRSDPRTDPSAPPRRRRRARLARWALLALAGLVGLAGTGMLYQTVATAIDRQQIHAGGLPGRCRWLRHAPPLHGHVAAPRWCSRRAREPRRRSGPGCSRPSRSRPACVPMTGPDSAGATPAPSPRDAASIARELHTLLLRAGETGPFVLAGHSLGGQYALMFAELYAEDTAGLVLIEAQHPDTLFRTPAAQDAARAQQRQVNLFVGPVPPRDRSSLQHGAGRPAASGRIPGGPESGGGPDRPRHGPAGRAVGRSDQPRTVAGRRCLGQPSRPSGQRHRARHGARTRVLHPRPST